MISKNQKKNSNKKREKFPLDLTIGASEKQRWPNNNNKKIQKIHSKKVLRHPLLLGRLIQSRNYQQFVKAANEKKQSNEPKNV